jgi:hypothetical protein
LLASLQKEVKKEKPENPEKDTSQEDSTEGKADEANEETDDEANETASRSEDENEGPEEGLEESNSSPVDSGRRKQVTVTGDSNKTASELRIPKKAKTAEEKKKAEQGKKETKEKKGREKEEKKAMKAKKDGKGNAGAPPLQCLPLAVHQLFYNAYVHESMCACKPVCRAGGRGISDTGLFKTCEKGQPKKRKQQTARITTGPCTGPRLALPSNDIDIDINDIDFND